MMYDPRTPPKITISEAMIHQTASRAVGMPAALRVVAIGISDIKVSVQDLGSRAPRKRKVSGKKEERRWKGEAPSYAGSFCGQ